MAARNGSAIATVLVSLDTNQQADWTSSRLHRAAMHKLKGLLDTNNIAILFCLDNEGISNVCVKTHDLPISTIDFIVLS